MVLPSVTKKFNKLGWTYDLVHQCFGRRMLETHFCDSSLPSQSVKMSNGLQHSNSEDSRREILRMDIRKFG